VAKRDAFGREIGEDPLAGLGWKTSTPAPSRWSPDREAPPAGAPAGAAAEARAAPPRQPAPTAPAKRSPQPLQRATAQRRAETGPARPVVVRGRRRRGSGTSRAVIAAVVIGFAALASNGAHTDTTTQSPGPAPPAASRPHGLSSGSMLRPGPLTSALAALQTQPGRLLRLDVAPTRVTAQLVTSDGSVGVFRVGTGGRVRRRPGTAPNGAGKPTIAYSAIDPRAPQRLTAVAAGKLGVSPDEVTAVSAVRQGSTVTWTAAFRDGQRVRGDAHGAILR
jgi:hypothetical protein